MDGQGPEALLPGQPRTNVLISRPQGWTPTQAMGSAVETREPEQEWLYPNQVSHQPVGDGHPHLQGWEPVETRYTAFPLAFISSCWRQGLRPGDPCRARQPPRRGLYCHQQ